jgi:hypothetical protein
VTATGEDLGELTLRLTPGATVEGTIESDPPDGWRNPVGARVTAYATAYDLPAPDGPTLKAAAAAPTATVSDGRFLLRDLFGPTIFRISGLPPEWALVRAWLEDEDVTDRPTDLRASDQPRRLKLVVTSRTGSLSGTITRRGRGPLSPELRVVVFAADESQWTVLSRYVAVATPDSDGRFSVEGLLPAAYLVAIADDLDDDARLDPTVLRRLVSRATAVTVAANDTLRLVLPWGGAR